MVVYLMKSDGLYKIGVSCSPKTRVKTIESKLDQNVEIVTTIKTNDDYAIESVLHQQFSEKREHREWFSLNENDVEKFKNEDYMHKVFAELFKESDSKELI